MGSSMLTVIFDSLSRLVPLKPPAQDDLDLGLYRPLGAPRTHQGPLHNLSTSETNQARAIFLTLHMLFPHELLPALDLLDRRLVTKLIFEPFVPKPDNCAEAADREEQPAKVAETEDPAFSSAASHEIFYVQSASASASEKSTMSRYRSRYPKASMPSAYYEVQLDSWNCTCPAFSVSAFQCLDLGSSADAREQEDLGATTARGWEFGGTDTLKLGRVPSCKHILAAVLVKTAPRLFKDCFKDRVVTKEEIVAWGSGWGEFGGS
ncbi:hypothetical protein PV04_03906 [Phialophora macrospora]|uniref:SWIM-type domain-containing protein n=1 Tax=Phialophora macrospora TaxID=1851006 RepID=A0A0D2E0P7_9EURO|nr:hypothetical protein PV04_03906 [Phialophora macrospora]